MIKIITIGGAINNSLYVRFSRDEIFSHQRIFFKNEDGNISIHQNSRGVISFLCLE